MSDNAKKGFVMFMVLMILTLFVSTAAKAAEEDCVPGSDASDKPWTLTIPGYTILMYGTICGHAGTPTEWEGRTKDKKKVFFSGTYILLGSKKDAASDNSGNKRIDWK